MQFQQYFRHFYCPNFAIFLNIFLFKTTLNTPKGAATFTGIYYLLMFMRSLYLSAFQVCTAAQILYFSYIGKRPNFLKNSPLTNARHFAAIL